MPKRFLSPLITRVADEATDRVLRNIQDRISELAEVRILGGIAVAGVELADSTEVSVNHGLGKRANWIVTKLMNPSTAGRIEEILGTSNQKNSLILKAVGYGATVTVDLWVF